MLGKSLLVEIIRFALDQQTSPEDFAPIRAEVDSRLEKALQRNSTVEVVVEVGSASFTIRRVYCGPSSPPPEVVDADDAPAFEDGVIPIRAFSQLEVIEFAREPVGRMILIDAALDLSGLDADEADVTAELVGNAATVTDLRAEIKRITEQLAELPSVATELASLAEFFDAEIVKEQEEWSREGARLGKLDDAPGLAAMPVVNKPSSFKHSVLNQSNQDLYQRAEAAYDALYAAIDRANRLVGEAYQAAKAELSAIAGEWKRRYGEFDARFSEKLAEIDVEHKGLAVLKKRLAELQTSKAVLETRRRACVNRWPLRWRPRSVNGRSFSIV